MTDGDADLRERVAQLETQVSELIRRLTTVEDIEAIKRLQRIYGYYIDKALWSKVIDLFTDDCTIEISGRGEYWGRAGAETVYRKLVGGLIGKSNGDDGLEHGQLHNHFQLQGVVSVADDGKHAKGRWRAFMQVAHLDKVADWAEGPYEMEYVKRDGRWFISRLHWFATYYTTFEDGWRTFGRPMPRTSTEFPPDRSSTFEYESYPCVFVPPFHFEHPVTGCG